jgi:hypothetical protein
MHAWLLIVQLFDIKFHTVTTKEALNFEDNHIREVIDEKGWGVSLVHP